MEHKGSKKHILDLIDCENFIDTINTLLRDYNVSITNKDTLRPKGSKEANEYSLQTFINKYKLSETYTNLIGENFNQWWKPSGGKAPTWDMISLCKVNGKEGILLVEAKAHVRELTKSGKPKVKRNPSKGSEINHKKIKECLEEQAQYLSSTFGDSFNISVNSHYQLSNRMAFASKLHSYNVPVVLLYLGFTGDKDSKNYFKDASHWEGAFRKYCSDRIPDSFINKSTSDFVFISTSLPTPIKLK